jgi:anthranilate synthase component 1
LVSTVTGELAPGRDAIDLLRGAFPGGSITGAPKVRAMQIIKERESSGRGIYAGAVGYLDFAGNLDFCIAIRTVIMKAGRAYVQAGAGIVIDSNPAAEYDETCDKAKALIRALELAQEGL